MFVWRVSNRPKYFSLLQLMGARYITEAVYAAAEQQVETVGEQMSVGDDG